MSAMFCSKYEVRLPDQGMYISSVCGAVLVFCSMVTSAEAAPLSSCSVMLPSRRRCSPVFSSVAVTVRVVSPRSPTAGPAAR